MNITDTSGAMPEAFDSGRFQIEKWKTYADAAVPGLKEICPEDLRETMNAGYFHQDRQGWKQWCDNHVKRIAQSFNRDLESMSQENQRYFGDWVSFDGHCDTGYYLGARFVRFLLEYDTFDRMILYGIREVKDGFSRFVDSVL